MNYATGTGVSAERTREQLMRVLRAFGAEGFGNATLYLGDAREALAALPAGSVHCCITSPPYWGLRDYGIEPSVWDGEPACGHEWGAAIPPRPGRGNKRGDLSTSSLTNPERQDELPRPASGGAFCIKCGAWRGRLGLEPTPDLYVAHLVTIFRQVRRVLRDAGTLWLNLGDSYTSGGRANYGPCVPGRKQATNPAIKDTPRPAQVPGLKPKDVCMIPARVALALQADGWYLRSQIPWLKRNAMPESATDRPTTAVEYVFLLAKSERYFYDTVAAKGAVRSGASDVRKMIEGRDRIGGKHKGLLDPLSKASALTHIGQVRAVDNPSGRARRNSDWFWESWQGLWDEGDGPLALVVNPAAFREAHFATFPAGLVEPCLKAGTSERGCCPQCGAPWRRVVEKSAATMNIRVRDAKKGILAAKSGGPSGATASPDEIAAYGPEMAGATRTLGWRPSCGCEGLEIIREMPVKPARKKGESEAAFEGRLAAFEIALGAWWRLWGHLKPRYDACRVESCTVLDPFAGAGTVALVANRLGRRSIGIEIKPEYVEMARKRLEADARPLTHRRDEAEMAPLFAAGEDDEDEEA